ncbi:MULTISPECIES: hormogonium polysaccharide secretion pseudopilin HpsC [unclassified Microcoleus]|uniref:hormogonium polysaccharide secretion pseudopilin HpsC n=1 Tax=unclassified Microcoleus TaxID=2642155 RepID=UPI002FD797B8
MKSLLRLLLKNQHQRNRSNLDQTEKGMTLVELLVGAIMAFLIITPMLGFVVDMLNTDRREQLKSNTEQDLQAAVDFISQDFSQAIYIYDNASINTIRDQLPDNGNLNRIPILVFWKRQRIKNAIPINPTVYNTVKPNQCEKNPGQCNDTDVLSLVAYYQFKDKDNTWCQPSGDPCPTRIARYEIRDGIRKPDRVAADTNLPYYNVADTNPDTQQPDAAFNKDFDFNKPTKNVTTGTVFPTPQVLVNYIDHSINAQTQLPLTECQTALGNPKDQKTEQPLAETALKVTDTEGRNSFYACVDTARNIARVTLRGNSLRRLQANDADFKTTSSAFFPTATLQIKGLGARGK